MNLNPSRSARSFQASIENPAAHRPTDITLSLVRSLLLSQLAAHAVPECIHVLLLHGVDLFSVFLHEALEVEIALLARSLCVFSHLTGIADRDIAPDGIDVFAVVPCNRWR